MTTESIKDKILKLLALAESSNPHEAELATAQAEKLMIKWGIEEAELQARGKAVVDDIITEHRYYSGDYGKTWVMFANAICQGLGNVRLLHNKEPWSSRRAAFIIGHKSDVDRANMLLDSLEKQGQSAMKAWWKTAPEREWMTPMQGFKARREFLLSFSLTVMRRLKDVRRDVVRSSAPGTDLVLVSREKRVDAYTQEKYNPHRHIDRTERTIYGRHAGRIAGESASLGNEVSG
jgi:hypothetical protein